MKIICAGYPKTGTKSMRTAFDILGYKNVHDIFEQVIYDEDIIRKAWFENKATREDIRRKYAEIDAVTDIPASMHWKQMFDAFPTAKVVLTVRDNPEVWVNSLKNMIDTCKRDSLEMKYYVYLKWLLVSNLCPIAYLFFTVQMNFFKACGNCSFLHDFDRDAYELSKSNYLRHNKDVIDHCPKEQLLIFNTKEGWAPLCEFLGKPIPEEPFPMRNVKNSLTNEVYACNVEFDGGFSYKVLREKIIFRGFWLCVLVGVVFLCVKFL